MGSVTPPVGRSADPLNSHAGNGSLRANSFRLTLGNFECHASKSWHARRYVLPCWYPLDERRVEVPTPDDMQELFKQAAKIAEVVPSSMQEAAFNRALDILTGAEGPTKRSTTVKTQKQERVSTGAVGDKRANNDNRLAKVTAVSRDNATEVDQETAVLGRSIALLVVFSREADVDGLTAPEIARILTEKFRHKTSRQAVLQALDNSGNMVDRQKDGSSAAIYRVMRPGEEWLSTPAEQRSKGGAAKSRRRSAAQKAEGQGEKTPTKAASQRKLGKAAATPAWTHTRKAGPKSVLETLIEERFFDTPRGLADVRKELRDQKALSYESTDLSPALTRLLREGKLKRSKADKQYVYTAV